MSSRTITAGRLIALMGCLLGSVHCATPEDPLRLPPPIVLDTLPGLCDEFAPAEEPHMLVMSASAQLDDAYQVVVDGALYVLGVSNGRIVYMETHAESFETCGFGVGTPLETARPCAAGDLSYELGWWYDLPLLTGWSAAFCMGDSCTDSEPVGSTPIDAFYQRNRGCR